ncbi:MAG TPA: hypothetical protein VNU48_04995, partial [Burkholderiaceae bacterium]|nr:hypothetical protein [Burkholderiaceae bacterium]
MQPVNWVSIRARDGKALRHAQPCGCFNPRTRRETRATCTTPLSIRHPKGFNPPARRERRATLQLGRHAGALLCFNP